METTEDRLVTETDMAFEPPDAPRAGAHRVDVLRLVWRFRWLLVAGALGGLALGVLAYLKLGPEYEAKTQILVSKTAAPIREGEAQTWGDRGEHVALIMSPMIVGRAVENAHLAELPSLRGEEDPVVAILDDLRVKRSAGQDRSFLNVFDISYRNRSAADAQAVVSAIVDAYEAYLDETRRENATELVRLITQAKEELGEQLRAKEQEYLEFRQSAPLHFHAPPGGDPTPNDTSNVHEQRLEAIEAERRQNLLRRAEIASRLKSLDEAIASGQSRESLAMLIRQFLVTNTQAAAPAALPETDQALRSAFESQLLPLLLREQQLLRDFGPDHPDVQATRRSIATLREYYRSRGITVPTVTPGKDGAPSADGVDFVAVYRHSLTQRLAELDHRDAELARLYEQETKLAREFEHYQIRDRALREEVARIKSLWSAVVRRLNELSLVKENTGFRMKRMAPVRAEFVVKRPIKFLGAGFALGLMLATALAYWWEWRDTTVKTAEEIRDEHGLAILTSVPRFENLGRQGRSDAHPHVAPAVRYLHDPSSRDAEAFRTLRTALFVGTDASATRRIQVTSPEPGDGKSTLASNLAAAVADSGRRVLLIDADLRRPCLHELFGTGRGLGLADVLSGDLALEHAIAETSAAGLLLLPAGTPAAHPAEMLASETFGQLLHQAGREFDVVIVDTPPLLAVSDACVVASQADGVLLSISLGRNRRVAVRRSLELLDAQGAHILGAVVQSMAAAVDDPYAALDYAEYYVDARATAASSRPVGTPLTAANR